MKDMTDQKPPGLLVLLHDMFNVFNQASFRHPADVKSFLDKDRLKAKIH